MKEIIKWSEYYIKVIIENNYKKPCDKCLIFETCDDTFLNFEEKKEYQYMCPYVCADEYIPITDPREILALKFENIKEIKFIKFSTQKDITKEVLLANKKRLGLKP